jgi:hypothetical protein
MSGIEPDTSDTTQLSKRLTPVSLAIADREDLFSIRLNPNSNIQQICGFGELLKALWNYKLGRALVSFDLNV